MISKTSIVISFYLAICNVCSHPLLKDVNDFVWLTSEPYFIDKTEMLTLIFDYQTTPSNNSNHFITSPFHFGKRKNLYMVKKFAEIEVDQNGNAKLWSETEARKIFLNLEIGKHPYLIAKHLARYPVIFLDLSVSRKDPLNDIPGLLKDMLRKSVYDYKWLEEIVRESMSTLVKDGKIDKDDAKFFLEVCKGDLSDREIDDGLFRLARFFYSYFNQSKVILLVDEYEKVALHALTRKNNQNSNAIVFYQRISKMLTRALQDGSEYFAKSVITGTGSLGFGVNQPMHSFLGYEFGDQSKDFIVHHAFLEDHPFAPYFGFLEEDVSELCNSYECKDSDRDLIDKMYKGYLTNTNQTMVYNPSAIGLFFQMNYHPRNDITYLCDQLIDPEWQLMLVPFMRSDVFRGKIDEVLRTGFFQYPIKKRLPSNGLKELLKLAKYDFNRITQDHVDMFFTVAFEQGYFSHALVENTYSIPNRVIEFILRLQFEKHFDS